MDWVMERNRKLIHFLVFATAVIAALLIAAGAVYEVSIPSTRTELAGIGRPRIGRLEAKVELILIEDLRCGACSYFTQKIFSQIQEEFIDWGQAYWVLVPVAFLEGSEPVANAALGVYNLAPERFLSYVHALIDYLNESDSDDFLREELIEIAKEVGGIDLQLLGECINTNRYGPQLKENFEWAKKIMGTDFATPTLFVEGVKVKTTSIKAVQSRIEKLEKVR
jgi:protein-disulfide isomerase